MKKYNVKFVVILASMAFIFIGVGIYFLVESTKQPNQNNEQSTEKYKNVKLERCNAKTCEYEINTDTVSFNLIYQKETNKNILTINNKEILNTKDELIQLIAFKNVMVLKYKNADNYKIKAFDKEGNVYFDYQYLDTTNKLNITNQEMEYNDGALFIYTSRLVDNNLIDSNHYIDLCNEEVKNTYNKEIVSGQYIIKYENYQFSKPSLISKKNLEEEFIKCD